MNYINYQIHLLLSSKYSFIIKLAIILLIYSIFYLDSIQDIAYCAKKTGVKKAAKVAEIASTVENNSVTATAVPFIAESKDEVVRGFQEQLRTIQIDSKAKHEEIITRLDEIKRAQLEIVDPTEVKMEDKNPYVENILKQNQQLLKEKKDLLSNLEYTRKMHEVNRYSAQVEWNESLEALEKKSRSLEKQNRNLIGQLNDIRKVNHAMAQTVEQQGNTIRQLLSEQLPNHPEAKETYIPRGPRPAFDEYGPDDIENGRALQQRPAIQTNVVRQTPAEAYINQYLGNCNIS